jgi:protease IV
MRSLIFFVVDCWHNFWITLSNWRTAISRDHIDFIYLEIFGELPEYTPPRPWWRRFISIPYLTEDEAPGPSMESLRSTLELIAADPRPKGILMRLNGIEAGWATAQTLRRIIARFRQSGKQVIAYADDYSTLNYYIASAADQILAPPIAGWNVIGIRMETIFIKEALDQLDIAAEVISISPYKSSGDILTRTDLSPENKKNLDSILDTQYREIVEGLAQGRRLSEDQVQKWIDQAPIPAQEALKAGLFDGVLYPDEFGAYLQALTGSTDVSLRPISHVWNRIRRPVQWHSGKVIGVIPFEGILARGRSQRVPLPIPIPFIGNNRLGQEDTVQAIRRAERDRSMAAVIIYVDSQGGSALASDMIWREIVRLQKKKPVVIYMNDVAASAAYYISVGAGWIVAQPLTLTGSIGVLFIRISTGGLFERLKINRVSLQRGAHAGIFTDNDKLSDDEYELIRRHVFNLYDRFNERVATGRNFSPETLEEVGAGRVWLGKQALDLKLVDQLGDFRDAIDKAIDLAGLKNRGWTPHFWLISKTGGILPPAYPLDPERLGNYLSGFTEMQYWMRLPFDIKIS